MFIGAGGGVGHMGIQIARAMGLRVVGVDGGNVKRALCLELGCEVFVDFTRATDVVEEVVKATDGKGAHGVIVTASNSPAYNIALQMLRSGGILMCVGLRMSLPVPTSQITNHINHQHLIRERLPMPNLPNLYSEISTLQGLWLGQDSRRKNVLSWQVEYAWPLSLYSKLTQASGSRSSDI